MYQGTTPAIIYTVAGYDLSAMTAYVSFKYGSNILTKTGDDITMEYDSVSETTTIICALTQQETLAMSKGAADTQIRFIDSSGQAYATDKAKINVKDVIDKQIITYRGE